MNTKEWIIEQSDFSDHSKNGLMESLFTMGNGFLGLRGNFPLIPSAEEKGTFINGFFESGPITYGEKAYGYADNWQTIVPLPEGKNVEFEADGLPLFAEGLSSGNLYRQLNLKEGSTHWSFTLQDRKGRKYKGRILILIPFNTRGVVRFQWRISAPDSVKTLVIKSSVQPEKKEGTETDDPRLPGHFDGSTLTGSLLENKEHSLYALHAQGSGLSAYCSMDNRVDGLAGLKVRNESNHTGLLEIIEGSPMGEVTLEKTVSYNFGPADDSGPVIAGLLKELESVAQHTTEELMAGHKAFMELFWKNSDVLIEGDSEAQLSLRYNLFQLLQSAGRDSRSSIAAKGLSGSGYEGHYFWDAETYVLPFFIYTNPDVARSMLKYRISIVPAAEKRAGKLSHKGILFPWRTINGEECSAYYPAGTAQYHINSDIALGLASYIDVTGDDSLLNEGGDKLLAGTARFWCDLGTYVDGKGFCFHSVTGPDEYTAIVDNNYFTNLCARENLRSAARLLENRVDEEERLSWIRRADEIYLPEEGGVTPQDDSFLEKEKWDFANTDKSSYPLLLHYHPLSIYRKQVLKQADVIMAQALFPSELSKEQMKRNFDYYEQVTTRDSSLSACAQGISAFHLGYGDLAWEYFNETLHTDRKDLHGNVSHGLHTAAMGGSFLMIIKGFLGLESHPGSFFFKPALPDRLKSISLQLKLKESTLRIVLEQKRVLYKSVSGTAEFFHYGKKIRLDEEKEESFLIPERVSVEFTLFRPKT
ncbi:glycoside hydrolase family 65 protein [Spirochaeta isovalerica]|uniref:Alpha,alpha-trehalose phosphorylase n=1 Tax=Spirochaeta isovalerica TaxID=150 RepID=A0A841R456_9SPIO|nr:glycoside hydrolase family 65 protein [Spirochaeta isovalerica]MBB6478583.1 alpha,alpha-trehalose phosphorylase [Spirochaeta isovalerica]